MKKFDIRLAWTDQKPEDGALIETYINEDAAQAVCAILNVLRWQTAFHSGSGRSYHVVER